MLTLYQAIRILAFILEQKSVSYQRIASLRSKHFHLVSKQRKTGFGPARDEMRAKNERGGGEGKEGNCPYPLSARFTCAIFRAVFDSRSSSFAPKPHGNACYAG